MLHFLDRNEGPQLTSIHNHIKLSFREGFNIDAVNILNDCLMQRRWDFDVQTAPSTSKPLPPIKLRSGIGFIEKSLQEKQKATDQSISVAFQDLSKLMTMAKDMVKLSQIISTKIRVCDVFIAPQFTLTLCHFRKNKEI